MKKSFFYIMLLFLTSELMASNGAAIIPHLFKSSINEMTIYVTNITNHPVSINIKLFDENGNQYTENTESGDNIYLFGAFTSSPIDENGTILEAQKTGWIVIKKGYTLVGFGRIFWNSEEDDQVAIIANGVQNYNNGTSQMYSRHSIPINNYQPF